MIISCIGDSLTEGDYGVYGKSGIANVHSENYPFFLSKLSGAEVRNFGKCGYTSTSILKYYNDGNIDVKGSDIILIMLGTNGGLDPDKDVQGNAEYLEIINKCKTDAPDAKIVLCTPPHATENPSMSNCGYAQRVNNAVAWTRKTAQKLGLYLVDVADCKEFCAENESKYQPNDGLHFSKEGYEVLAKYIFDALKKERLL